MEKEYLTIRQFAEAVGKSQQAIHQQLETRLKKYVKVIDNRKYIDNTAIREVFGVDDLKEKSSDSINELTSIQVALQVKDEIIKTLKQQIEDLRNDKNNLNEQLKVKDAEIDKLHTEIDRLQTLLDQQQQLHKSLQDQQQLLIESKSNDDSAEAEQPKKRGFFGIFRKV